MVFGRDTLHKVVTLGLFALFAVLLGQLDDRGGLVVVAGVPRLLGTITPTLGTSIVTPAPLEIPRDYWIERLDLRVSGTYTVTAGGGNNGTLHDENPMSIIDHIKVEGMGGERPELLKFFRGEHAYRIAHLLSGQEPGGVSPITSAGVQATTAFRAIIPVHFRLPHRNVPPELSALTLLDPTEWKRLALTLSFGLSTGTAFQNGGDRVSTVPSLSVDVFAICVNPPDLKGAKPIRYVELEQFQESTAALVSNGRGEYTTKLKTGLKYAYHMVETRDETSSAFKPVDDTLQAVTIAIGGNPLMQYQNHTEYHEQQRKAVLGQAATNPSGLNALSSRDNFVVGYHMFDFLRNGRLSEALDTRSYPAKGTTLQFFRDIATASTRQHYAVSGFLI